MTLGHNAVLPHDRVRRVGGLRGRIVGLVLIAVCCSLAGEVSGAGPAPVMRIELQTTITSATNERLRSAMAAAQAEQAQLLVIELDTPGGLMDATRSLVRQILEAPLPVVVFVSPDGAHAGSAGLFLTLAAHVAAMVPSSNLGAAHPVTGWGGDVKGDLRKKVVNDAAAWARSLAETRGRNGEWAAKAVTDSAALTAAEALEHQVVDLVVPDFDALLVALDGRQLQVRGGGRVLRTRGVRVLSQSPSFAQTFYELLSDPSLVYVLLLLGFAGLFLEFQNPGLWVPGALGLTALLIVFFVQTLPINAFGVALILASAGLLLLEVYVTSFGLLTVAGLGCLVIGSYMLFDVPESSVRLSPWLIWTVASAFALSFMLVGVLLARAKLQGPTSGVEALIGQQAVAHSALGPEMEGKIFFDGTFWNACADQSIAAGAKVRVTRLSGLLAHVEPVEPSGDP